VNVRNVLRFVKSLLSVMVIFLAIPFVALGDLFLRLGKKAFGWLWRTGD